VTPAPTSARAAAASRAKARLRRGLRNLPDSRRDVTHGRARCSREKGDDRRDQRPDRSRESRSCLLEHIHGMGSKRAEAYAKGHADPADLRFDATTHTDRFPSETCDGPSRQAEGSRIRGKVRQVIGRLPENLEQPPSRIRDRCRRPVRVRSSLAVH